jgi:hypothetical protein
MIVKIVDCSLKENEITEDISLYECYFINYQQSKYAVEITFYDKEWNFVNVLKVERPSVIFVMENGQTVDTIRIKENPEQLDISPLHKELRLEVEGSKLATAINKAEKKNLRRV